LADQAEYKETVSQFRQKLTAKLADLRNNDLKK